jgi:hypothetical protein
MSTDRLELLVEWPGGRKVSVEVSILPDLQGVTDLTAPLPESGEVPLPTEEIGPENLESLSTLHGFLARLTRNADQGEVTRASCTRVHEEKLLEMLAVEGPPPDPIPVRLPSDA